MPEGNAVAGRPAQRRRTRRAIVDATSVLIAGGHTPTVTEIAEAADVSRRTVYMHFPSLEQLMIDATLGALSQAQVDQTIQTPELGSDPIGRVEALARALGRMSPEVERLGRSLIRLTVEHPPADDATAPPRRGYRRVEWIETALEPARDQFDDEDFRRLVHALTMVMGWEALIAQRDICGLDAEQGEELSVWAARALTQAALDEAQARPRGTRPGRSIRPG